MLMICATNNNNLLFFIANNLPSKVSKNLNYSKCVVKFFDERPA